jgi:BMFP domain-containing protein YqiC
MAQPDRFAIIPIYSDSTGLGAIPQNAVAHGSWAAITGRIRDSRQQREMLTLINDAAHAKETIADIRAREDAVAGREDAVAADVEAITRHILSDAISKIDALAARMDSLEARRAYDPDDDDEHALSPGIQPRTPAMED